MLKFIAALGFCLTVILGFTALNASAQRAKFGVVASPTASEEEQKIEEAQQKIDEAKSKAKNTTSDVNNDYSSDNNKKSAQSISQAELNAAVTTDTETAQAKAAAQQAIVNNVDNAREGEIKNLIQTLNTLEKKLEIDSGIPSGVAKSKNINIDATDKSAVIEYISGQTVEAHQETAQDYQSQLEIEASYTPPAE